MQVLCSEENIWALFMTRGWNHPMPLAAGRGSVTVVKMSQAQQATAGEDRGLYMIHAYL